MEVKRVYMDLVEGEKDKRGVWRLESEAFKDPIKLEIGYENKELAKFQEEISELRVSLNNKDKQIYELESKLEATNKLLKDIQNIVNIEHENVKNLVKFLGEDEKEIKSLYKAIADIKMNTELFSGTIIKIQDKAKEIEKKITKQPRVFRGKTFVSGHEGVSLTTIDIESGDYLLRAKYTILEHNEFVENKDDVIIDKIHVDGNIYLPMYQLQGGTQLDKPTATIGWDLVLIPC